MYKFRYTDIARKMSPMLIDHESNFEAYSRIKTPYTLTSLPPFYGSVYNLNAPTFHRAHTSLTAVPKTDALGLDFCVVVQSPNHTAPFTTPS